MSLSLCLRSLWVSVGLSWFSVGLSGVRDAALGAYCAATATTVGFSRNQSKETFDFCFRLGYDTRTGICISLLPAPRIAAPFIDCTACPVARCTAASLHPW